MKKILHVFLIVVSTIVYTNVLAQQDITNTDNVAVDDEVLEQQARDRENEAGEDPLAKKQAEKVDSPDEQAVRESDWGAYTSLRMRYRSTGGEASLDDGGSRVGAYADWQVRPGYWVSGNAEVGFNFLNRLSGFLNPGANASDGESDLFLRLGYLNFETPNLYFVIGKAWSTYYKVAGFTDRFAGTGASASGAFNAGTDGGPSGTGRADNVLQSRIHIKPGKFLGRLFKPFALNVQVQKNQSIPDMFKSTNNGDIEEIKYNYAAGLSALLETRTDFNLGVAYNRAQISDEDIDDLNAVGIDGDDKSFLLGARWFNDKWYLATNISWLWNHMTTEDGIYFDGRGWETYGQYNLHNRWWVTAGWNYLQPYSNQLQVGNYKIKYGVIGLRYSFNKFNRMIYANVRVDSSTASDIFETEISNTYTVGVRWNIPK